MTTEIALDQGWVPEACTLPTAQRPLRLAEFDALFATAVKQVERVGVLRLRLTLTGPVELEDIVRDLTERESRCCSFLAFTVTTHGPGQLLLDVAVPAAHVDVLDALTTRASQKANR